MKATRFAALFAATVCLPLSGMAASPSPEAETWEAATSVNTPSAYETYLKAYPKGRYVTAAKIRLQGLKSGNAPSGTAKTATSPQTATVALPVGAERIPVEDASWQTLSQWAQYRNAPRVKPVSVSWESSSGMGEDAPAVNYVVDVEIEPAGDHCGKITRKAQWTLPTGNTSNQHKVSFFCGLVDLGSLANGVPQTALSLLSVKGSLFPLKQGARYSSQSTSRLIGNDQFSMFFDSACRVVGQRPASELHANLPGTAWVLQCSNLYAQKGQQGKQSNSENYFLEALGIPLSMIGQLESLGGSFIVPQPGTQTTVGAMHTTYSRYDVRF